MLGLENHGIQSKLKQGKVRKKILKLDIWEAKTTYEEAPSLMDRESTGIAEIY